MTSAGRERFDNINIQRKKSPHHSTNATYHKFSFKSVCDWRSVPGSVQELNTRRLKQQTQWKLQRIIAECHVLSKSGPQGTNWCLKKLTSKKKKNNNNIVCHISHVYVVWNTGLIFVVLFFVEGKQRILHIVHHWCLLYWRSGPQIFIRPSSYRSSFWIKSFLILRTCH